jgi:hypothetical protein
MEDPEISVNFMDVVQNMDEKIKTKQLFDALTTTTMELAPPAEL